MNYYLLFLLMALARASPYGALQAACASMTPGHGFNPQNGTSPFIVMPLTVYNLIVLFIALYIDLTFRFL